MSHLCTLWIVHAQGSLCLSRFAALYTLAYGPESYNEKSKSPVPKMSIQVRSQNVMSNLVRENILARNNAFNARLLGISNIEYATRKHMSAIVNS